MSTLTIAAAGDSFITRRLPEGDDAHQAISSLIGPADVRFTNLEVVIRRQEGFPSAQSGGTWASAPPEALGDLKKYGFNAVAWATNHTLDYSYGGLEATLRALEQYGFVHAGAGRDLAEASQVRYVETRSGRAAFIAVTSTFHESWAAGEQRRDVGGRPGVHPLRYQTTYRISAERMKQLKAIAAATGINDYQELMAKEGFSPDYGDSEDVFTFGQHIFAVSSVEGTVTKPNGHDMRRIKGLIGEARRQADYVLVSVHSHEMAGGDKEKPAGFLTEFARSCIDEGAHAVLGHGPHIVRGVEIYKGRPILYSLGNFIFQNDTVERLPADFYEKYGLTGEHNTADALDARSGGDTRGLGANPKVWSSVIALLDMEGGVLKQLTLYPISLGYGQPRYRRGWPVLTKDTEVLTRIQRLSREFGTELTVDPDKAEARWTAVQADI
jgi:poly-gamma-glutamate synthesis protein (capsule biosynthesis protein)